MKILIACEESQSVCKEFRALGHEAFSADLQECSGGHPEWHIQGDVKRVLQDEWDLIIAHPECRYIANSGVHCLHKDPPRWGKLDKACDFFNLFLNHPCPKICIENPVPHKYALERFHGNQKYTQTIQPWQFGEDASKRTCLWLKGLPPLIPTDIIVKNKYANQTPSGQNKLGPSPERAKLRSKTYSGIAKAMAAQWGRDALPPSSEQFTLDL